MSEAKQCQLDGSFLANGFGVDSQVINYLIELLDEVTVNGERST